MKKILLILLSALSLTAMAQNTKARLWYYTTDTISGNIVYRYKVDPCVGLYRISIKFGVSQASIIDWNPALKERGPQPGEELLIPKGKVMNVAALQKEYLPKQEMQENTYETHTQDLRYESLSKQETQQIKTVAVLSPICRDSSVIDFFQQMVRGAMESAVTASAEYEAYDRSAFDQIQKEQAFQRTGVVIDSQIKKMGEMAGVDYVLVSEVSAYDGYLSVVVKILNVTTGKYDKSVDDYTQLNPESVKIKCREMASSLFFRFSR